MAWTSSDLAAIDTAIANGTEEVRFADRSVRYRSIADLLKARDAIANQLSLTNGTTPTRQYRAYTGKGWND